MVREYASVSPAVLGDNLQGFWIGGLLDVDAHVHLVAEIPSVLQRCKQPLEGMGSVVCDD